MYLSALLDVLPGLDRTPAFFLTTFIRPNTGNNAEDEGCGESNLGLGQHCRISLLGCRAAAPAGEQVEAAAR